MDRTRHWAHRLSLTPDPLSTRKARDFVSTHLVDHDLRYLVEDVRTVVSELATNALLHADTPFVIDLHATDATVVLTVADGSVSMPARGDAESSSTSGRGLSIVDELSRDWGVTRGVDGGKSVWAVFDVRKARPLSLA